MCVGIKGLIANCNVTLAVGKEGESKQTESKQFTKKIKKKKFSHFHNIIYFLSVGLQQ